MEKADAGSGFLNDFLHGGYEKGVVNTIYGPPGSGKTLMLMLAMTKSKGKLIFIDTEGGFSTERLKQVCPQHEELLARTIFLNPTNFDSQDTAIEKLKDLVNSNVSMVVMDTLTTLYRVEMNSEDNYSLNKVLAKQLRDLVEIARKKDIPVLVTAQVYSDLNDPDKFNVVGGTIVKNMSKCLLELRKDNGHRKLIVKKHRSMKTGKSVSFEIVGDGVKELDDQTSDTTS